MSDGIIVGGDLSLRSTGLTALGLEGNLIDFDLILSDPAEINDEELLDYNAWSIVQFLRRFDPALIRGIAFENLSFGDQKSREYDMLCANFWHCRWQLWKLQDLNHIPIGVIPVESWRAKVLSGAEKKQWKEAEGKLGLKLGVVSKLPTDVRAGFDEMVSELEHHGYTYKKEKNPIFDLADSYWLSRYRLSLE